MAPVGWMPAKQTPSTEATAWAKCATPTDLKVDKASWKFWQTSSSREAKMAQAP